MATEALKTMKEQLMSCVQGQLSDLTRVNTHELGEAIDMIKDLAEAIYYCTITDSMEKSEEIKKQGSTNINYYTTPLKTIQYPEYYKDGYMYYPSYPMYYGNQPHMATNLGTSTQGSSYMEMPNDMKRDPREGRSYMRRRMYMEGKELHKDINSQMKELQAYLQELSTDITEMIKDASPQEKATLRQKMTNLANKIG